MSLLKEYKLKASPFEVFSHKHKMANREDEWKTITESLESAFEGKGPRYFVLLGDYGVGKTYMLERIYAWVSRERPQKEVFPVYGKRDVLYEKRLAVMESEPRWAKFGLDFIMRIFDNIERERIVEVLSKVNLSGFRSDFGELFKALKDNDDIAFRCIKGQKLPAKELREVGLDSPISDSPAGIALFFDFLRIIGLAKYTSFLVLVDEFEYIATLGERKITQILNTFGEIFDRFGGYETKPKADIAKPTFMFATSPGGWDTLSNLAKSSVKKTGGGGIAPFMERLSPRDRITLRPFSLENTEELVAKRLAEERERAIKDALYPFTRDAVGYVHEVSFNKPRNVIQYCGILLEDAAKDDLKKIDARAAREILERYGIHPPESGRPKKAAKKGSA